MILFLILLILYSNILFCHEVNYSINQQNCYVIEVSYGDGTKFSYESYEIYKPGNEEKPFQVGRTDERGRICFLPNREGKWKIKAFTEDGHGVNFAVEIRKGINVSVKKTDFFERFSKPIFGVGLLLTIFSILNIFLRRKK